MLEYTTQTTLKISACICDRCQRRLTPEDMDWHEGLSLSRVAGYASVFGDGNAISLDLCPECVKEVLGQWIRISRPAK